MIRLWNKFSNHFSQGFLLSVFGSGVTRIAGMGAGFVFFALIAQQFGADTMGRYAIATTIMGILSVFCLLGFSSSIVRFVSADFEQNQPEMVQRRLIWVVKLVGCITIVVAVILALLREVIAVHVFSDPALSPFLLIVSLVLLPYSLSAIFTAYHQGAHRISFSSALRNLIVPLFSCLFFMAFLPFITHETYSILAQALAITVSFLMGLVFYLKYRVSETGEISLSRDEKKKMLAVSLPLLTGGISGMLLGWADTLMLGAFVDAEAAGLYAAAFRLSVFVSLPLYIVGWAVIPRIAAAYKAGDRYLQQKLLSDSVHLALAGSVLAILLFMFLGHFVLSFFGSEFTAAYWVLVVLCLGEFIVVYFGHAYSFMIMTNQEKQYQNIMISAVVLNIALNFFLIPVMGIMGAALATLFTQAFKQLLFTRCVYKHHRLISFGGFAWMNLKRLEKETSAF